MDDSSLNLTTLSTWLNTSFTDSTFGLNPLESMDHLRQQKILCDCVLLLPKYKHRIEVHRIILAASSSYFRSLVLQKQNAVVTGRDGYQAISNDLLGNYPGVLEIDIKDPSMQPDQLQTLVDFAYTQKVNHLDFPTVQWLLPLADQWGMLSLVEHCGQYLNDNMDRSNCTGIWLFAETYSCFWLAQQARQFTLRHFWHCTQQNLEFLQLDAHNLNDLLSDDALSVPQEQLVYKCIKTWIEATSRTKIDRIDYLPRLLSTVRFGITGIQFIADLKKDNLIMEHENSSKCLREIEHTLNLVLEKQMLQYSFQETLLPSLNERLLRPRIPSEVLFAIGGWTAGNPTNLLETFDCKANKWFLSKYTDSNPRAYHGVAELKGKIYVIGGFDGFEYFNSARCFDPLSKQWTEIAPMYQQRCYVSVAVANGKIYAIGGFDGITRLRSVECYDPVNNQWSMLQPMHRMRSDAGAASNGGKIYVAGGFNGQEVLQCVEFYCPESDSWSYIPSMTSPRSGVSLISYEECLFVLGGFNGHLRLNTVESFDFKSNRWSEVAPMLLARSNFAVSILDGFLFAFGGFNGETTISNVERFDSVDNQWHPTTPMTLTRSAVKTVVLTGLSNVKEYSFHGDTESQTPILSLDNSNSLLNASEIDLNNNVLQ